MATKILGIEISEEWLPNDPWVGPPFPRSMKVMWPWVKTWPYPEIEEAPPEVPEVPAPPGVVTYHLYAYAIGKGTVAGGGEYPAGSVITLLATPQAGATFTYWSGDVSGTSPTVTLVLDRNKTAIAHFKTEEIPEEEIPPYIPPEVAPPEAPPEVPEEVVPPPAPPPPVAPPSGQILEVTWWDGGTWHPMSEPMPKSKTITHRFRVRNTGNTRGLFKIGTSWRDIYGEHWRYSGSVAIEAGGEDNIDWPRWTGGAGTVTSTYRLYSDDTEVDSVTVRVTKV